MKKPEINQSDRYSSLGIFRHFSFVRYIYDQKLELEERVFHLEERLDEKYISLISNIKSTNNNTQEYISDSNLYDRRPDEPVKDWLRRIDEMRKAESEFDRNNSSSSNAENSTVTSASNLVEQARRKHIQISGSAISRIANSLEENN